MTPAKFDRSLAGKNSDSENPVSKSQLKREARALKTLASDLLKLNASQLKRIPLDDDIFLATNEKAEVHQASIIDTGLVWLLVIGIGSWSARRIMTGQKSSACRG